MDEDAGAVSKAAMAALSTTPPSCSFTCTSASVIATASAGLSLGPSPLAVGCSSSPPRSLRVQLPDAAHLNGSTASAGPTTTQEEAEVNGLAWAEDKRWGRRCSPRPHGI